ncbi:Structural maintenance of chromosomes protein like [Quillaja saponaria]|uniref:Structural maintenance of chromosomes protein like n=1 Tax=Quillaja saponaria TaxID=32244 RepID=A0AAD7QHD3_QUISA|nr:Structural maintenance of chromosomes protein like [Quillaja saponaria]
MTTMDVKGITWVGNIYQKFEAMCLEVEEMMYEDTVKYVENQVQTVGASVKKFYSDVMEDLLPPTSMDSDPKMASKMLTEPNSDVGVCKKSNGSLKEKPVNIHQEKLMKESTVIAHLNKDASQVKAFDGFCKDDVLITSSYDNSVKEESTPYSKQCGHGDTHTTSNLGINENQEKTKNPLTGTFGTSIERDICRESSLCEVLEENHEVPSHHGSVEFTKGRPIILVKSVDNVEKDTGRSSSSGLPGQPNGISMDKEARFNNYADSMVVLSHADGSDFDAIETDSEVEPVHETVEQADKLKLEETCVMVNGYELPIDPQTGSAQRPYKIRHAFSSRMKSGRKQEHEQLAVWYGNSAKANEDHVQNLIPTPAVVNPNRSLLPDTCEYEWELI